MAWIVGIDEAGYGPNLGPLVVTSVACRVADAGRDSDLWHLLRSAIRRRKDVNEGQLLIDDSKAVYIGHKLAHLERGVLAALWRPNLSTPVSLDSFVDWLCPDHRDELHGEVWYRGVQTLPVCVATGELKPLALRFDETCAAARVAPWLVRSVVVCPARFNALLEEGGKKGVVLAHALAHLLRWQCTNLPGDDDVSFFIDKHGGRNTYAAMIQHALPDSIVSAEQEGLNLSCYRVHGLQRAMRLSFLPRADSAHMCVALASMTSKYLREVLMLEFNRFWQAHIAELRPTAGYPVDAARFLADIRTAIDKLGLREETLWRRK